MFTDCADQWAERVDEEGHVPGNRRWVVVLTLKAIEARLPADAFCRVHKTFIVALDKISSFLRTKLFIGKQEIPVGSSYVEEFERKYGAA